MHKKFILLFIILTNLLLVINCMKDVSGLDNCTEEDTSLVVVKKPNIYIYPQKEVELEVKLIFPTGGSVIESIPEYGTGWNVFVEKSGLIEGQYRFLYYESRVPNLFQYESGWIVKQENLESFFKENMKLCGFVNTEINDFIEYWIPKLNNAEEYLLYPQFEKDISRVINLQVSERPESLLRLFYVIKENTNKIKYLKKPSLRTFERKGFTVVEWGVIVY